MLHMKMSYSPLYVVTFLRDLLRNMYREYGGEHFSWDEDPRKSQITIGTVSNQHSGERIQQFPRILIQRGGSMCQSQFIANNLDYHHNGGVKAGGTEHFRQDINGSINFIIEARNEGTCEELGEFTRRFLCWSKPFIETTFGFQAFAKVMQIGACELDHEDTEKFKININVPYIIEDRWTKSGDLVRLNHIFREMINTNSVD